MNFDNDTFREIILLFANFDRNTPLSKLPDGCIHFHKEVFKYDKYIIKKTNYKKNQNTDHYLFENEALWLEKLQKYSFVPKFYGKFYFENNIYLIMEYIQGCSINNLDMIFLKRFSPFFKNFKKEMYDALDVFATEEITHKDLRPANIIINNSFKNYKIIDYQFCSAIGEDIATNCEAQNNHYKKAIHNVGGEFRMPKSHAHNFTTDRYAIEKVLDELQAQILTYKSLRNRLFYSFKNFISSTFHPKK